MSEWLPIESAPKNDTLILLYDKDRQHEYMLGSWKFDGWWSIPTPSGKSYIWHDATNWMPLPTPPKEPEPTPDTLPSKSEH